MNLLDVKGMERLTVFQHYEVGEVYDVVDRSHACIHESLLQPPRRLLHNNIRYDSCHVSSAVLLVSDFHIHKIRCLAVSSFLKGDVRILEGSSEGCCSLSGHSYLSQTVRSVRGNLEINNSLSQLKRLCKILPHLILNALVNLRIENPYTVSVGNGNNLVFESQFTC